MDALCKCLHLAFERLHVLEQYMSERTHVIFFVVVIFYFECQRALANLPRCDIFKFSLSVVETNSPTRRRNQSSGEVGLMVVINGVDGATSYHTLALHFTY